MYSRTRAAFPSRWVLEAADTLVGGSPLDALRKGRQIVHLMRAFNVRHGLTAEVEEPSARYASNPTDGAAADSHPEQAWPIMKRNYYRTMGWNEDTGMPLPETLRELELEELIPDFALA